MTAVDLDIPATAAGVAADIRQFGHCQGATLAVNVAERPNDPCCVLWAPTVRALMASDDENDRWRRRNAWRVALVEAIGSNEPVTWNDTTPTSKVLEVLDGIAAGTTPTKGK